MQNNLNLHRTLLGIAAVIIILAGVKLAAEIVVPFLLSLFIAIICSPMIKAMTQRRVPHWLAITLLFVLISLVFFFLVGLINSTAREFTQSIPQYKILLSQRVSDLTALSQRFNLPFTLSRETIQENFDPSSIMNFVSRVLLNFSGVVSNVFVLVLVVIFMLAEAPTIKHKFAMAISSTPYDVAKEERHIDRVLQGVIGYLGIKSITSLLTGVGVFILLEACGVQYAILWATLSFLLNYIPNIGSIIAAIPIIVQALLLNGFGIGFGVAIGVIAINMVVGNIIEPKMMGQRLGLSTLVVFLSLLFWGWLLGTVGMLLSVPLTMALKIALESSPNTAKYACLLGDVEDFK
ncbi:AI-2E family transporter [Haemophilus influenzae]|uniref:AI-2E family transporter n=1 Tax=Haemophilus influenzae TaxID=727 RepID=UPI000D00473F|nr:AI-2E family transporter [Haemophilus influenzae]PRI86964.1 AI-2 transport protein TqsA [Haemophilus influenzae]PRI88664.1 AI-2 transport protein TqsA [Haemophilus influenzae]PRJ88495.1 AI-2 transport protein TqsA [Haemophilus influenzae]